MSTLPTIRSIKLVTDIEDDKFYQTNYCKGICADECHRTNRISVTEEDFMDPKYGQLFQEVVAIDMSCLKITLGLLKHVHDTCKKVHCIFIQESQFIEEEFAEDVWHYFIRRFAKHLIHLGVDNTIRVGSESLNCSPDLAQLFKQCKQLEEVKGGINETVITDWKLFTESFKSLPNCVRFICLDHDSGNKCFDNCPCQIDPKDFDSEEASKNGPIPESQLNVIFRALKQNLLDVIQYLRLETDICPYHSMDTSTYISSFQRLIALNFSFHNSLFDEIDYRVLRNINGSILELKELESVAGQLGDQSVEDVLLNFTRPIAGKIPTSLRLIGGYLLKRDIKKMFYNFQGLEYLVLTKKVINPNIVPYLVTKMKDLKEIIVEDCHFNMDQLERALNQRNDMKLRIFRSQRNFIYFYSSHRKVYMTDH